MSAAVWHTLLLLDKGVYGTCTKRVRNRLDCLFSEGLLMLFTHWQQPTFKGCEEGNKSWSLGHLRTRTWTGREIEGIMSTFFAA